MVNLSVALEEAASHGPSIPPLAVGGIALGILLFLLFCVLVFGAGRDHT
jgi:hypothetical protein